MIGDPRKPGSCSVHFSVVDAWENTFGHTPAKCYVDKDRIKVKDFGAWYWGATAPSQIENLTALDNGQRYKLEPGPWEVKMVMMYEVAPMTPDVKKRLQTYNEARRMARLTTRQRINGVTRMVPIKEIAAA